MINLLTAFLFLFSPPADDANALLGTWLNGEKDAKIEIYHCGNLFCGRIVWLENPIENGATKKDKHNPDETLKKRELMGLHILTDFVYTGDKTWEEGKIYNPKDGKTYSCYMSLLDNGQLKVRGFIGFSLIGKTQFWTRTE
jgi:uncharacterized protein (DUF2147 family)